MARSVSFVLALALVHSWYDHDCCADRDCHPVPCDEISRRGNGDYIWQHAGLNVYFSPTTVKPSLDSGCHVCVPPHASLGTCLYLAPRV